MLIDTNVFLEVTKAGPDPRVFRWFDAQDLESMYVSVITLGELRLGVERHDAGRRQAQLRTWLEDELAEQFRDRILTVDARVADQWGRMRARQLRLGRPRPEIDALVAATAIVHDLAIATRNTVDFVHLGIELISPWDASV